MATKRLTKEEQEIFALQNRIFDLATGALGGELEDGDGVDDLVSTLGSDGLARFMGALRYTFDLEDSDDTARRMGFAVKYWNIDEYKNTLSVARFLYRYGVRA